MNLKDINQEEQAEGDIDSKTRIDENLKKDFNKKLQERISQRSQPKTMLKLANYRDMLDNDQSFKSNKLTIKS